MVQVAGQQAPIGPERLALDQCEPLPLMQHLAQRGCNRVLWECGRIWRLRPFVRAV